MPNYEYLCEKCGERFTKHYAFTEDSSGAICVNCGVTASKAYTAPPIHFKGGGWGGSK